ncbi:lysine N(6)-hydroxylase/L-ornithine N(5)-oxygenase family protein [Brachybacterium sacelli]|uniref:L-lysine N6-monooxygenase MbtG n=1 Tax=Brachybacterium sacelli TaxID=173364 RepID=A0ABS4X4K8_9MICO|nr:SidA/IucD/PvdA family monooxygenase [Brachybacterium sacelli]MBP2383391.1 lysine N6-hydroxylase [Brachybacterium sacelli]
MSAPDTTGTTGTGDAAAAAATRATSGANVATETPAPEVVHDLVGIGIGPFGLGMAALAEPLEDVDALFLDQAEEFRWHPGMMLESATIQVPFLADLVTLADPTSPYSFLAFLKATGRLYPFYIRESFYPLRSEYDAYCRWVAEQLDCLRWRRRVIAVEPAYDDQGREHFAATAEILDAQGEVTGHEVHRGRHLVLGVGTQPTLPPALASLAGSAAEDPAPAPVIHSARYRFHREQLLEHEAITVVGSGQSAAEIYRDLLEDAVARGVRLDWITRSPRFFPMEYTKLTLEMTSPEYTDHHRSLPEELRDELGRTQRALHKGISSDLLDDIHETLYRLSQGGRELPTTLLTDVAVTSAHRDPTTAEIVLGLRHGQLGTERAHRTGAVVAATGYRSGVPGFLAPLGDRIRRDRAGRLDVSREYTVDVDERIHVLGTEVHTHGVTAPDLGFGPWRASVVLAALTGREPYPIERRIAFQTFGLPPQDVASAGADT